MEGQFSTDFILPAWQGVSFTKEKLTKGKLGKQLAWHCAKIRYRIGWV
jgi:hypothetical protein